MDIFLNILFLIIGMVLLIYGADFFVSGASAVAKKLKVPSIIIGLTIVAIGTSLPELAVSLASAIKGNMDLSAGNVVGSNLMNMLLILGIVAVYKPIQIEKSSKKFDLPFMLMVTGLFLLFSADTILNGTNENILSRSECIVLFCLFIFYTVMQVIFAKRNNQSIDYKETSNVEQKLETEKPKEEKELKVWQIIVYLIGGLGAVVFGGECVSSTAQFLAIKAGMSEALVGLTIVAMGTSLPELATSVIAAKKGDTGLALGNVIGSNIANIILILGGVGLIGNIPISTVILTDTLILFVFTAIFLSMCYTKSKIERWEGVILLVMYFSYLAFAIVRNYCF